MRLSAKAQKFLDKNPTLIQTLHGYKFYEHPVLGEDTGMVCVTPCGRVYKTDFMDRLSFDDLVYQVNEWRETKPTFGNVIVPKSNTDKRGE